jgi:hypothetical protein
MKMGRKLMVVAIGAFAAVGCGTASRAETATVTTTSTSTATVALAAASTTTTAPPSGSAGGGGPCNGNPCIGDWQREAAEGGQVVQCNDGAWSHAGGLPGACSYHGGESTTQGTSSGAGETTTAPSTGGSVYGVEALPVQCGAGVAGSAGMSCTFAENAFYEYWQASGGDATAPESISVWSAEGQHFYLLTCAAGDGVIDCTGVNGKGVSLDARFTQDAVSAYTTANAQAYAASGKLGPTR